MSSVCSATTAAATTGSVDFAGSFSVCVADDKTGNEVTTGSNGTTTTGVGAGTASTTGSILASFGLFFLLKRRNAFI